MARFVPVLIFACLLLAAPGQPGAEEKAQGFKFRTDPQIKQTAPRERVSIKLKRDTDGKYSWEISGESADEVLAADEKLKKKLGAK